MLNLQSGNTYDGKGGRQSGSVELSGATDITLVNWVLDGVQIKLSDCARIKFQRCVWQNVSGRCLNLYGTCPNIDVLQCTFNKVRADSCIFCDNGQLIDSHFNENAFDDVTHGLHVAWGGGQRRNDVEICRNRFRRVQRFAIECQNGVDGLLIASNSMRDWQPNTSRMAISCATGPMDGGAGAWARRVVIANNFSDDPNASADNDAFAFIESMGLDTNVHHNAVRGRQWGVAVLTGWSTPAWRFAYNLMACHYPKWAQIKLENRGQMPAPQNIVGNREVDDFVPPPEDDVVNNRCDWQDKTLAGGGGGGGITPAIVINTPGALPLEVSQRGAGAMLVKGAFRKGRLERRSLNGPAGEEWGVVTDTVDGGTAAVDAGPDFVNDAPALNPTWEYRWRAVDAAGNTYAAGAGQVAADPVPQAVVDAYPARRAAWLASRGGTATTTPVPAVVTTTTPPAGSVHVVLDVARAGDGSVTVNGVQVLGPTQ